ncbi:unnamed protein product [Blepharisma stoltei]|uniref:Myb-like DNA-binding domain containing protein n=1 Tax=Blepharisma stoltei TaxID=1481888 RepID=A0AAU9JNI1_9CILI|nr:unnamed protein product [Blepharisma stoltei]
MLAPMENINLDSNHPLLSPYRLDDEVWMVPCKLDTMKQKYYPLVYPRVSKGHLRHPWIKKEDDIILSHLPTETTKKWTIIAREINQKIHNDTPIRNGKQCRERWCNHLNPDLKKGSWSNEEDEIIIIKQKEIGNKWSIIAKFLPGRTENSVKNRWKSIGRKRKCESSGFLTHATGAGIDTSSTDSHEDTEESQNYSIRNRDQDILFIELGLDEIDPIEDFCL